MPDIKLPLVQVADPDVPVLPSNAVLAISYKVAIDKAGKIFLVPCSGPQTLSPELQKLPNLFEVLKEASIPLERRLYRVSVIKQLREIFPGMGLREAKDLTDLLLAVATGENNPSDHTPIFTQELRENYKHIGVPPKNYSLAARTLGDILMRCEREELGGADTMELLQEIIAALFSPYSE